MLLTYCFIKKRISFMLIDIKNLRKYYLNFWCYGQYYEILNADETCVLMATKLMSVCQVLFDIHLNNIWLLRNIHQHWSFAFSWRSKKIMLFEWLKLPIFEFSWQTYGSGCHGNSQCVFPTTLFWNGVAYMLLSSQNSIIYAYRYSEFKKGLTEIWYYDRY